MKYAIPLLLIATVAQSTPIERSVADVTQTLQAVQLDIDGLDQAVKSWTTDPTNLLNASNKLVATITMGTQTISASGNLSLTEAITLLPPVQSLTMNAQTLVSDLKVKKPLVQSSSLCDVVSKQINDIGADSKALIDATISKIPDFGKEIAKQQAEEIIDTLNDAQDAFSAKNCVSASG